MPTGMEIGNTAMINITMANYHIHRQFFRFILFVGLIPLLSCSEKLHTANAVATPPAVSLANYNRDILQHINEYRQSKGLNPLQMNTVISGGSRKA
jgi:uncharacterized protein YkwD